MAKLKKEFKKALKGDLGKDNLYGKEDAKVLKKYYRKEDGLSKQKAAKKAGKAPLSNKLKVDQSFTKRVKGKDSKKQYGDTKKINASEKLTSRFSEGKGTQGLSKRGKFKKATETIEKGVKEKDKINSRSGLMKPKELKVSYKDKDFERNYDSRLNKSGMLAKNKDGSKLKIAEAPTAPTRNTTIRDSSRLNSLSNRLRSEPTGQSSRASLIAKGKKRTGR